MAEEDAEQSSKTEDPSAKRLKDAHDRGDVAKSQELTAWFMLGGTATVIALVAPSTSASLMSELRTVMANADQYQIGGAASGAFFTALAQSVIGVALIPMGIL